MSYERITADQIKVGDRIAEIPTYDFNEVKAMESIGPSSRWIRRTFRYRGGERVRPRWTTTFWREQNHDA